jgi:hypothetical protein
MCKIYMFRDRDTAQIDDILVRIEMKRDTPMFGKVLLYKKTEGGCDYLERDEFEKNQEPVLAWLRANSFDVSDLIFNNRGV